MAHLLRREQMIDALSGQGSGDQIGAKCPEWVESGMSGKSGKRTFQGLLLFSSSMVVAEHSRHPPAVRRKRPKLKVAAKARFALGAVAPRPVETVVTFFDCPKAGHREHSLRPRYQFPAHARRSWRLAGSTAIGIVRDEALSWLGDAVPVMIKFKIHSEH